MRRQYLFASATTLTFAVGANVGFGTQDLQPQSGLAVRTVVWKLGFPAPWVVLIYPLMN